MAFFIYTMHRYPHHIGDFDRATRHLTRIERSIYRDLLDVYYDTEKPLTLDMPMLCRKVLAKTNEEVTAVEQTLNEFFTKTPTGWYHDRCEAVIDEYRSSTSQKALAGKASAAKRALKRQQAINGIPTAVQTPLNGTPTNQEPITVNHKPLTKETTPQAAVAKAPKFDFAKHLIDDYGADPIGVRDWMKSRKRSTNTESAFNRIVSEASKAGLSVADVVLICAGRGWQGFEAEWLKPKTQASQQYQTANDRAKAFADRLTGRHKNEQQQFIDINEPIARKLG